MGGDMTATYVSGFRTNTTITRNGATDGLENCVEYWSGTFAGSTPAGANLLSYSIDDRVDAATSINYLRLQHNVNGDFAGSRQTFSSVLNVNGLNTDRTSNRFYVSANFGAQASVNVGGTSETRRGHLFGANPDARLIAGATHWDQLVGDEINVAAYAGSSVNDKIGMQIVKTSLDAVKGDRVNSAFVIGDQVDAAMSGVGWDIGISFGADQGYNSIASTGTLIGTDPHAGEVSMGTVAFGIDWSLYTFTTAFLKSVNFIVDGVGNLIGKTLGVTPATAPSDPASGWTIYCDSGDGNKLKARSATGTVVILGTP